MVTHDHSTTKSTFTVCYGYVTDFFTNETEQTFNHFVHDDPTFTTTDTFIFDTESDPDVNEVLMHTALHF